jgi:RNA polymerase sigma factor (sigma-70 family)
VMDKLSAEDIFKGIAQLPRGYRMVFTLYAVEGFKHEEIGIKLGITTGTSKSNLSKARIKLQKILLDMQAIKIVRNG